MDWKYNYNNNTSAFSHIKQHQMMALRHAMATLENLLNSALCVVCYFCASILSAQWDVCKHIACVLKRTFYSEQTKIVF